MKETIRVPHYGLSYYIVSPVDSTHKGPVMQRPFSYHAVIVLEFWVMYDIMAPHFTVSRYRWLPVPLRWTRDCQYGKHAMPHGHILHGNRLVPLSPRRITALFLWLDTSFTDKDYLASGLGHEWLITRMYNMDVNTHPCISSMTFQLNRRWN